MTLLAPPTSTGPLRPSLHVDLARCLVVQDGVAGTVPAAGSEPRLCAGCAGQVWLSPSGQRLLAGNPELTVVCVDCATAGLDRTRPRGTRREVRA